MIICCEHNPCPSRPRWWLSRFSNRPWYCPQCSKLWVTRWHAAADSGFWAWHEAVPKAVHSDK